MDKKELRAQAHKAGQQFAKGEQHLTNKTDINACAQDFAAGAMWLYDQLLAGSLPLPWSLNIKKLTDQEAEDLGKKLIEAGRGNRMWTFEPPDFDYNMPVPADQSDDVKRSVVLVPDYGTPGPADPMVHVTIDPTVIKKHMDEEQEALDELERKPIDRFKKKHDWKK